ncbi:acyl carrier protein [Bacillus inaquosorum]|nr:acyl carrier protein [Bacillus inaquosorum]
MVLKLPADQIEADADFMTYGMDSVMVLKLTQQLEGFFGSLPKTLFFEYKTVDELTGYFLQHHREALTKVLGDSQPAPVSQPVGTEKRHKHSRRRRKEFRKAPSFSSSSSTPILPLSVWRGVIPVPGICRSFGPT